MGGQALENQKFSNLGSGLENRLEVAQSNTTVRVPDPYPTRHMPIYPQQLRGIELQTFQMNETSPPKKFSAGISCEKCEKVNYNTHELPSGGLLIIMLRW